MSGEKRKGACLCGAVRVEAELKAPKIGACHCGQCRTWTGGSPFYCVEIERATVEGEDNIGVYAASEWGERGFCKTCGTTLFWRMQGKPLSNLAAGLFEDQNGLTVSSEIFTDRRAPWQTAFEGATQSTEAEEFGKLEAALGKPEA